MIHNYLRRLSLAAVLCFVLTSAFAQYKPIIEEGKTWVAQYSSWGIDTDINYWIQGQTEFDGVMYDNVWAQSDGGDAYVDAHIREDVDEQRVYVRDFDSQEHLLYDFDVQTGDFVAVWPCTFLEREVLDVQEILLGGEMHKMILFDNEYWVEGVGSIFTLLFPGYIACLADFDPLLKCCVSAEWVFSNPDFIAQCEALTVDGFEELDFELFPNPAEHELIISGLTPGLINVQISDMTGKSVFQTNELSSGGMNLDLRNMASGVYMITISSPEMKGSQLFIKD